MKAPVLLLFGERDLVVLPQARSQVLPGATDFAAAVLDFATGLA